MTPVPSPAPLTEEAIQLARQTAELKSEIIDPAVPGLRLRITKGGGTWYLLTRGLDQERQRLNLGSWPQLLAAAAQERALTLRRRLDEGDGPLTIEELIDEYELFKGSGLKRGPQTLRAIRQLMAGLMTRHPSTISSRDIAQPLRMKALTAPSSANRQLAYVKAMFSWAKSQDLIETNPARNIPKPAREIPRERTPSLKEVALIWEAALSRPAPYSQIVRLLILTGCRLEEVAQMRLEELELKDDGVGDVWTLPAHRTKTGKSIRIPLSPAAKKVINEVLFLNGDWVFATRTGMPFKGWSRAKAMLNTEILRDDLRMEPWKLHDLRRSFATYACEELGVRIEVVDRCLNHVGSASTSAVSRVYARSELFAERRKTLEDWGAAVMDAVKARREAFAARVSPSFDVMEAANSKPTRASIAAQLDRLQEAADQQIAARQEAEASGMPHVEVKKPNTRPPAVKDVRPLPAEEPISIPDADLFPEPIEPPCRWAGWIETGSGKRPTEKVAFELGEPPRQAWADAIEMWSKNEGGVLRTYDHGVFIQMSAEELRFFLIQMENRAVEGSEATRRRVEDGQTYKIVGWRTADYRYDAITYKQGR